MLSDGGGAAKAKSQQIHLLSPAISQRNWTQFVFFRWQQIWKHYVEKPSGKIAVCIVIKIYKSVKVIRGKKKKKQLGETNMLFSRITSDICIKIHFSILCGHLLSSTSNIYCTGVIPHEV